MNEDEKKDWLRRHWPQPGDSLFAQGEQWESNALISLAVHPFLLYAQGYKIAADAIVEKVEATHFDQDYVIYPVCFLYRHYLELMLKGLIRVGRMLDRKSPGYPKDHGIDRLWVECRPMLEAAFPEGERNETDAVANCIKEFGAMDPVGQSFRFPEDKSGKTLLPDVSYLNLTNIRDVMARISGFLEGSYDGMCDLHQSQCELDAYYSDDS